MVERERRPRSYRYGLAVVAVAAALGIVLLPDIGKGAGSVPFFAVLITAWYGGLGPGLFATGLTAIVAVAVMAYRESSFEVWRAEMVALFVAGGVGVTLLVEALHAARRRAEAAQRWLTGVLTSIGDAVIATDADGRITFTNPVAHGLTGWGADESRGKPLGEVFRIVSELPGEPAEDPVARVFREGVIVGLANHTALIARDGTERPIADSAAPIRDENGGLSGAVLVFRDVSDQRRAEEALRASEERFRLTADFAPVLIWIAGTDGRCQWFNRPWLEFVGREMGHEIGEGWRDNVHPDDLSGLADVYSAAFDARRPFSWEYRLRRHDGTYRWVVDHGLPLSGPGGEFTGFIGSCFDITDRRHAEDELRTADRRKDEFLAMLAHELRNPLSAISNAVQLAKTGNGEVERGWVQEVLERQVRHLARLIDDLLDVSRITRGKIRLRSQLLELGPLLRSAVEAVQPLLDSRGHRLTASIPEEPLPVKGDPTRLEQIVVNLLTNAAKYTESGGEVLLTAGREGDAVFVTVRDTGVGIPPEQLSQMFELFAQGDRTLARSEGGLGIGLTLARSLAEMHGGSVVARSEGRGRGSEFTVRLPAARAAADNGPPPTAPPAARLAAARRVLVVDDNADTAQGLSRLMAGHGHDVRTCHDGPSALEAAAEYRPDVVLLDIGLPGMDGLQVARRLREAGSDAFIIAVSGYGQDDDRRRSRDAGIDHHLVKPVDHVTLLRLIARDGRAVSETA
jgi:PAS domain S-box-containing protein